MLLPTADPLPFLPPFPLRLVAASIAGINSDTNKASARMSASVERILKASSAGSFSSEVDGSSAEFPAARAD